jgi:hypothetical protein
VQPDTLPCREQELPPPCVLDAGFRAPAKVLIVLLGG